MKERNYTVDLAKYIAAICVIAIHTEPFSNYSDVLNVITVQIIARLAVPFFAVCTGYYAAQRAVGSAGWYYFRNQWSKLFRIYTLWSALYLVVSVPKWIGSGWFSAWAFVDFAIAAVRSGAHYHLWYLLSLLYAWPIFYLFLRRVDRKLWLPVSIGLYFVKAVSYAYRAFLPDRFDALFGILGYWDGLFNGVFLLLPLMLLGAYNVGAPAIKRSHSIAVFILSFLVLIAEVAFLYDKEQQAVSYIFSTYPTVFFLFITVLELRIRRNKSLCGQLGAASLFVYCFHPMLVELLEDVSISPAVRFLVAAIVSTCAGLLIHLIIANVQKRRA